MFSDHLRCLWNFGEKSHQSSAYDSEHHFLRAAIRTDLVLLRAEQLLEGVVAFDQTLRLVNGVSQNAVLQQDLWRLTTGQTLSAVFLPSSGTWGRRVYLLRAGGLVHAVHVPVELLLQVDAF